MFISTLPIRINVSNNISFIELAKSIASNSMSIFRHQKFPFSEILKGVRNQNHNINKLYNIMVSYQNARADLNDKNYTTKWYTNDKLNDDIQIHILDIGNSGVLTINYDYLSDIFSKKEIEYLHTRLMAIIKDAIKDKDVSIEEIKIMSQDEELKILNDFNNTKSDYKNNRAVIDMFEEMVKKSPDNIALIFEDKEYTYRELNERANSLAKYLSKLIKPNDIVALILSRNDLMIITIIAILKCRGAYLPIDSKYPIERINYIIKDSNAKLILSDSNYDMNCIKLSDIDVFLNSNISSNLNLEYDNRYINYVIYTSGSTGNPKGVCISCQNLVNFVLGINKELGINESDNILSITTISFDIFGLELWLPLVNGATLVLANKSECTNPIALNDLCIKNNVNTIQTTPTKLGMLIHNSSSLQYIKNMKRILIGGECVKEEIVNKLKKISDAQIFDVYGPTETTIWSTIKNLTNISKVVAGKPISNTRIYILDTKNRLLPIGISGEVGISGDGLAIGYINNSSMTDKKFIYDDKLNERIYLTGDYGKINLNGDLVILDRIDLQVKLNGQRIELLEIEKCICKYNNIKDAIVCVKNNKYLVCFYTLYNQEQKIDINMLIKYLYDKLPIYMIPNSYFYLDSFPYTLNGKVDRKELQKIEVNLGNIINDEKPHTLLQNIIYNILKDIFKNKEFGINDKLSDLGADSLDIINIQINLFSYGIHLSYNELYEYQSIKELEQKIIQNSRNNKERLLTDIDDYSSILNTNMQSMEDNKYIKHNIKGVMLTGVTGFLGAHILDKYMQEENGKIYCLVRVKNNLNPFERLYSTLRYYFGNKYDNEIGNRIIPIDGDITNEDMLGLSENDCKQIQNNVDVIIHSAACVKHYGDAKYFEKINVEGTRNISDFCYKNNKKMIHISTLSVSGNSFETAVQNKSSGDEAVIFDETSFYKNQNLSNIYVYTKFKSEEIVLKYINKGMDANIIRVGNLTGRSSDLKFQPNIAENAFFNRIKTLISIKVFPEYDMDMYLEFTPVDLCSLAIIKIMQYFNMDHNMFHLYNNNHVYINRFIQVLKKININVKIVNDKNFESIIKNISNSKNKKILNSIINDFNDNEQLDYSSNIEIQSSYTREYLKKIGFEWEYIDDKYIIDYINYMNNNDNANI